MSRFGYAAKVRWSGLGFDLQHLNRRGQGLMQLTAAVSAKGGQRGTQRQSSISIK